MHWDHCKRNTNKSTPRNIMTIKSTKGKKKLIKTTRDKWRITLISECGIWFWDETVAAYVPSSGKRSKREVEKGIKQFFLSLFSPLLEASSPSLLSVRHSASLWHQSSLFWFAGCAGGDAYLYCAGVLNSCIRFCLLVETGLFQQPCEYSDMSHDTCWVMSYDEPGLKSGVNYWSWDTCRSQL